MRLPKVRSTGGLMVFVMMTGLLTALLPLSWKHTWWEIKPFINLILLPIMIALLTIPQQRLSLRGPAIIANAFLLLLWFFSRRPYPGSVLLGSWPEEPIAVFRDNFLDNVYGRSLGLSISHTVYYYYRSGGMVDLAFLTLTLGLSVLISIRPMLRLPSFVLSVILAVYRLIDWMIMPRVRPYDQWAWLDPALTPFRLLRSLLAGNRTKAEFWSDLGRVRPLEFMALTLVFLYLTALSTLQCLNRRRTTCTSAANHQRRQENSVLLTESS